MASAGGGQARVSGPRVRPRRPGHAEAARAQPAHTCRSLTLHQVFGEALLQGGPAPTPTPRQSQRQPFLAQGSALPGDRRETGAGAVPTARTPTHRASSRTIRGRGPSLGTSPPTAQPPLAPAPGQVAPGHRMGPVPLSLFPFPCPPPAGAVRGQASQLSGMGQPRLQRRFPPPQGRARQACWGQASGPGLELPPVPGGPWAKALAADPWVRRG